MWIDAVKKSTLNFFTYIVAVCGTPGNGTNTVAVNPTISLTYGQTYEYTCLPGYTTNDAVET